MNNGKELVYWFYGDVLSDKDCDNIIATYDKAKKEKPIIGLAGNEQQNLDVRNVERVLLPTYKGVGGILTAVGIDANRQAWNFNIERANQAEFLKYPSKGKYEAHIDTFMIPSELECRKLTVLVFLNDNFKGGRFFLQTGHNKVYPIQKKGTILVFPSFLMHGVEPITKGIRYSVVTWLVGPWFN